MFLRVLFLLLLALNIGGALWIAFSPPPLAAVVVVADPGVPVLTLLSENETDPIATSAELVEAPQPSTAIASDNCFSLGPFATQSDLRAALNRLTPSVKRTRTRDTRVSQARGYWVFLGGMKSREEALGVARTLSSKGVRDYYVVTAGDQQNTVSLGLFREKANAERRRAEITGMGFEPELIQRTEEMPVYWLDYASAPGPEIDWRSRLPAGADLQQQPIPCF